MWENLGIPQNVCATCPSSIKYVTLFHGTEQVSHKQQQTISLTFWELCLFILPYRHESGISSIIFYKMSDLFFIYSLPFIDGPL